MNLFDKICAVIAFAFGVVLLVAGVCGLFIGVRAWFSLPPIIGILPAFAGWGIVRAVYFGWPVRKVVAGNSVREPTIAANDATADPGEA
jgi:hypothetical protein